jgi:hypothetical protein
VGLAKLRWRVEHDDRELKDALGPLVARKLGESLPATAAWDPI